MAELVALALKVSIFSLVFALGLKCDLADTLWLFRRPGKMAKALLSTNIVMPLFAALTITMIPLHRAAAIALMALALSPVPPILPRKQIGAGGAQDYAIGLLVAVSLLSIAWIPLAVELVEHHFGIALEVPPLPVAKIVLTMIIAPLVVGIAVQAAAKSAAAVMQPIVSRVAMIGLGIGALLILFSAWRAVLAQIGDGTALAYAVFIIVGLLVGHILGGPEAHTRTDLALASASKHPGIALAIAHLTFPEEPMVLGAILLFLLLNLIIAAPYVKWRSRLAHTNAPAQD